MNNELEEKNKDEKINENNEIKNDNNEQDFISELSFLEKLKYSIDKYKIDFKERKIKKEKELAKLELERTRQELERVVELERLAKEKLELEKKELETRREQAKIREKQIEADKLRLEEEEKSIQKEQQRRFEEQENRRKLEEERKQQEKLRLAEEKRLEEERKQQEKLRIAEEKRLAEEQKQQEKMRIAEEKRLEEERKQQEKMRIAEEKRLEEERKQQEKLRLAEEKRLAEEQLAKERAEKRKLIEEKIRKEELAKETLILKEQEEKNRLEEEKKNLLKQINDIETKAKNETREARKLRLESSSSEQKIIDAQNNIFKKELQINEEKLKLEALNKKDADEKTIQTIEKKEALIANLLNERQLLLKNLEKRKKELNKENKNLIREEKIDGILSDIKNIKQEVIGENEKINEIIDEDGKKRNLFVTIYHTIIFYLYTKILKKDKKELSYVVKSKNNIKVRIGLAIVIAALISILFFLTLKLTLSEKDIYGESTVKTEENAKQEQKNKNDNNEDNKEQEKIEQVSDKALEEEVAAKETSGIVAYYFPVDRIIKTKEKIHIFNSPNWNDAGEILPENTELNVNLLTSPGGYLMYQIKDGNYAGKFVTANDKLVSIEKKNDTEDKFTNKPVAIRIIADVYSYKDEKLSDLNASVAPNVIFNILGITKNENNRLVYNISDGTFIPVEASKIVETQRPVTSNTKPQQNQTQKKDTQQETNKNRR